MKRNCFVSLILLQVLTCTVLETAPAATALTVEDCGKCHTHEYQLITARGRAHKVKVTCLECHAGHRPLSADNIPECSDCHGRRPHAEMIDCSSCHGQKENCRACHQVHQPLARTDGKTALAHCRVCHPRAFELLQATTTKHHDLSCGYCHREHRKIPQCSDCHGLPHSAGTHKIFRCNNCHGIAHDLVGMPDK
jgi:hypothetical protein